MRLIRNINGSYARHFAIDQEVFRLKNKCLEGRVIEDSRRGRQMFVYNPKMMGIDPFLFFAVAMAYSRLRR